MDGPATSTRFADAPGRRAAALGDLIDASAADIERDRRLPPPLLDALHEQALFRMLLPKPYGGEEAAPLDFMDAIETLARHDASTAWCVCQGNGCAMTAAYLAPEVSHEIWGRDPRAVVAWGPGRSEARQTEGGYLVSGSLMFASGGRHATWLGVHSPVRGPDGETLKDANGDAQVLTSLLPAAGVEMRDIWNVIGLRGTASDAYEVKDLFVPAAHTTLRDDPAGRKHQAPLYEYPAMSLFAVGFASLALGVAQGFLGDFLAFAQGKTPRLAKSTVAASAVAQSEAAEAAARIGASRAFLRQEAGQVWRDTVASGALTVDGRVRIRLAATFAIHEAKTAVDALYDLAGADAIFVEKPFERRFRDMHTVTQQLQGRKTHYRSVGAWMMGGEPDLAVM